MLSVASWVPARDLGSLLVNSTGDHVRPKFSLKKIAGSYCIKHMLKMSPRSALPKDRRDVFRSSLRSEEAEVCAHYA